MHPQVEIHVVAQEPAQNQSGGAWDRMQLTPLPGSRTRGGGAGSLSWGLPRESRLVPALQTFLQAKRTGTAGQAVMCGHQEGQGTRKDSHRLTTCPTQARCEDLAHTLSPMCHKANIRPPRVKKPEHFSQLRKQGAETARHLPTPQSR